MRGEEQVSGDVRTRSLTRVLARDLVAAAGLSVALVFLALEFLFPELPGEEERSGWEQSVDEVVLAVVLLPLGYWIVRNRAEQRLQWLTEGRDPTSEEGLAVITFPWWVASVALRLWLLLGLGVLVFNLVDDTYELPLRDELFNASSVVLAGLTSAGVAYLVTYRRLRPVYPAVLAGAPPPGQTRIGLRSRLLLSWALCSGIPVVMILVLIAWRGEADLNAAVAFLAAATLVAGAAVSATVARSLADPINELRSSVERVTKGDLGVVVSVDDASEVGYLQSGFNAMTAGLRERRRLEDLFGRYVGVDVARRALATDLTLGGEHRVVSVLFVDLTGSTRLATRQDPTDVVATLNRFFGAIVTVVTAEGGWVNKFHGDGALCIFGAPLDQLEHTARALCAARFLGQQLRALPLDFGIGVSSGMVVAGNGAESRFEYTVIGDPVNEAARLTELAKTVPCRIIASGPAVANAGDEARYWSRYESLTLRGRDTPTDAFIVADDRQGQPP